MTILFDATKSVKTSRNFGLGLLPAAEPAPRRPLPTPRPYEADADDRAWWAAQSDRLDGFYAWLEAKAAEVEAEDALAWGLLPRDLMSRSLVGHEG